MTHLNPSDFEQAKMVRVEKNFLDLNFIASSNEFLYECFKNKHSYNFNWLGLPIIQFPEDILSMQEIIFSVKPDIIIETGVARGGSLAFYASMLKLLGKKKVIGIDLSILEFNRKQITEHFLCDQIDLVEGDSTSIKTLDQVKQKLSIGDKVLVSLDSNHSHKHVFDELVLYSDLVSIGSYLVVFDCTIEAFNHDQINELKKQYHITDWDKGNNPGSAVAKFLEEDPRFELDNFFNARSLISNCRGGFLKRIS
jgi:cephalosporin hydroxylase